MKGIIVLLAVAVSAPQITQAQGTVTYLSNVDQPSTGSVAVGSDSWLAMNFITGTNAGGYSLDSIQLRMADASGNPSGFTVMVYGQGYGQPGTVLPGSSLGTLNGSLNPVTAGIYIYTSAATLTLSPQTPYFIVLTAGTGVANGVYEWSLAAANSYNPNGGWAVIGGVSTGFLHSSDGSSWTHISFAFPQFALDATGVPEPSALGLLTLGVGLLVCYRGKARVASG